MSLNAKRIVIAVLGVAFLGSLLFAQWMEVVRKQQEAGIIPPTIAVSAESRGGSASRRGGGPARCSSMTSTTLGSMASLASASVSHRVHRGQSWTCTRMASASSPGQAPARYPASCSFVGQSDPSIRPNGSCFCFQGGALARLVRPAGGRPAT